MVNTANAQGLLKDTTLAFLNIIYPKRCQGCGIMLDYKDTLYICKDCLKKIKLNKPPFCIKCGCPVCGPCGIETLCGKCINVKHHYDRAYFCCNYDGLIKDLIHKFKYQHKKYLICLFDKMMLNFAKNYIDIDTIDMIVPIPLHRGRLQERGFDQSLLLSENLAKQLNIPLSYNILARRKDTKQQTHLNKKERSDNIKGAFFIKGKEAFSDKRVLLIDDVSTTAATANECAKLLKRSGAKLIYFLTLARGL